MTTGTPARPLPPLEENDRRLFEALIRRAADRAGAEGLASWADAVRYPHPTVPRDLVVSLLAEYGARPDMRILGRRFEEIMRTSADPVRLQFATRVHVQALRDLATRVEAHGAPEGAVTTLRRSLLAHDRLAALGVTSGALAQTLDAYNARHVAIAAEREIPTELLAGRPLEAAGDRLPPGALRVDAYSPGGELRIAAGAESVRTAVAEGRASVRAALSRAAEETLALVERGRQKDRGQTAAGPAPAIAM